MRKIVFSVLAAISCTASAWAQTHKIEMITDSGRILIMLYDNTPKNTANMVKLAKEHYYDGLLFHRVIPQFMIQGGDSSSRHAKPNQMLGMGGLGYTVPAEFNDSDIHKRGALGVARTDTPNKAGSACQFYIVVGRKCTDADLDYNVRQKKLHYTQEQRDIYKTIGGTPRLDGDYTVFGEVLEGMDVVDRIANAHRNPFDRPVGDIHIISARLVEPPQKKHGFFSFLRRKKKD